jgi:hypothetical protein
VNRSAVTTGLLPALLLSLAACGAPQSASASTGKASNPNGVPPAALCAFFKQSLTTLQQSPSQYDAMMAESSQISKFYQDRNALQAMDGVDLDATTKKLCPGVRQAVLAATGQKTLNSLRTSN